MKQKTEENNREPGCPLPPSFLSVQLFMLHYIALDVYRSTTSPVPIDAGHLVTSGITETNYTDCGNVYNRYYAVTAVNENGESDPSNEDRASESCGSAMAMTLPVLNTTALTESGNDPVVTKYYFFALSKTGASRVAMDREGVVQWLVGDHLGTTSVVLNANGTVHSEARHYPYGEERWSSGTLPTNYRFAGQRQDSGLGLYFMGARQYDPALGRWISADTIVPEPTNPQSLNRYAYVRNSPLNYVDPTGHMEDGECGRDGEQCGDDDLPPLPDWLIELLSDHPQLLDLLAMAPSAGGYYGSVSFSFGVILEVDVEIPVALMFNWHSGELTFLYGLGTDAHLGGPRFMSASVSGGNMWTWGASQNELLKGIDAYAGLDLQVDALAEAGGGSDCQSLPYLRRFRW